MKWIAYRRSTEGDHPKPEKPGHEWVVTTDPYRRRLHLWFPDTDVGRRYATEIAEALNESYVAGMSDAQRAARLALGMSK